MLPENSGKLNQISAVGQFEFRLFAGRFGIQIPAFAGMTDESLNPQVRNARESGYRVLLTEERNFQKRPTAQISISLSQKRRFSVG